MDDVHRLIERIREQVFVEADRKFADETFQHLRCSPHNERIFDADVESCVSGDCGCTMEISLKFRNGCVEKAGYMTDGDPSVRLCGSCVADMAVGKSCSEILAVTVVDVLKRLGRKGGEEKCAQLALSALRKAVLAHCRKSEFRAVGKKRLHRTDSPLFVSAGKNSPHLRYDN